ncbi:uncharacterized protein LOC131624142 [Vicia villosa]|uniref:uncharacterized protein LOC131624142 n=1 Tax=Vicia villosa TaxID=3911 RepID=UPI00273B3BF5|nr:uncharacterized protein LOC131624142 [Vicia villosa]
MADKDDPRVDLLEHRDFQLVSSRKRRNKKLSSASTTKIKADEYRGRHNPNNISMREFFQWDDSNHLHHLPTIGSFFTWSNGRKGNQLTEKRLDRVMCNLDMIDTCPNIVCHTLNRIKSDHFPLLYTCDFERDKFKSQFKFLKMWSLNDDYEKLIGDVWKTKVYGCPMYILDRKLRLLKGKLKDWNKHKFRDVKERVVKAEKALNDIQRNIGLSGYNDWLEVEEAKAQHDLEKALILEEAFWKEKENIKWHFEGDKNTKFFHTYAKIKKKNNIIASLNVNDTVTTDSKVIELYLINHFSALFNQNMLLQDSGLIQRVIPCLINDNTNAMLTLDPSEEEIYHAVMNLNSDSAPGPDGFGPLFFQKYWSIIKCDVIGAVNHFFIQDWVMPHYNANTIVLIPKTNEPNSINNYRPIALANCKFKIITKIMADRLATILPSLISKEKNGFVMGRNIKDSICLTSEAINILHNKSYSGNVALKIDISKAFDTISWKFLLSTLECFSFCIKFCSWISTILHSAHLSIGFNGKQAGYFKCTNGVRQGDPLGDHKSLNAIDMLLKEYASCSGKFCNNAKSLIYAGGMSLVRLKSLADLIGFSMANPPFVYLRAPIFVGRPKPIYFLYVADKIKLRLASWKSKLLTMAGRLQLVKSVIQSTVVHFISIYNWPGALTKQLTTWIRNFIWSGSLEKKKMVTVAWKHCCRLKDGGLGLKSLEVLNLAANLHLCWWLEEPLVSLFKIPEMFSKHFSVKVKDWIVDKVWHIPFNVHAAYPSLRLLVEKVTINDSEVEDSLAWTDAMNGELTLKMAYDCCKKQNPKNLGLYPWDRNVPPSNSMLIWRLDHGKMPTDDNLAARGFKIPSMCSLCSGNAETSSQLFFHCKFVYNIWAWLRQKLHCSGNITCLKDCADMIKSWWSPQAKDVALSCICSVFYCVWQARNKNRFEDRNTHWRTCIVNIIARAKLAGTNTAKCSTNNMDSFTILKSFDVFLHPGKPMHMLDVIWSPPPKDWIKVNVDGLARGMSSLMACGGIFRNMEAEHIGSFCDFFGEGDAATTELLAATIAIEKIKDLGFQKVWLESDCLLVVKAFSDTSLVPWKIRSRWLGCLEYTRSIEFMISHAYREANFCADLLANLGLSLRNYHWFSFLHSVLVRKYLLDKEDTHRLRLCS